MTKQPVRFTFFLLICLLVLVTATAQAQPVDIPDPNLRAVIERNLGKTSGATITATDMTTLTRLSAPNANISDLRGLEEAINLTALALQVNNISDISRVEGLTSLTQLVLYNNPISDISPVEGLTNLTYLYFGNNNISDISPVEGLTNLIGLTLGGNSISNISPVEGLTNLIELHLWGNSISDISPLARLANLTKLHLEGNSISDISPLVANTGLGSGDEVHLSENPLSYPSIYTHIRTLQNRGVDVTFDNRIPTTLQKISALVTPSDNVLIVEVRDSEGRLFEGVPVTFTIISGGGTLSVTTTMTDENGRAQTTLTLGTTGTPNNVEASAASIPVTVTFSDVAEPVVDIPDSNLRAAIETALGVASGTPIVPSDMATLTHFEAGFANISDLTGLEFATNLTSLALPITNISDISPLAELTNLTGLNLAGNSISDISPVARLVNLRYLYLPGNNISDISPLVANTGLGNGDEVRMSENPLSYPSIYTHIPTLQNRGVDVTFDNRIPTTLRRISRLVTLSDNVLIVEVRDSEGRLFEGVSVTFTIISGGGTLNVTATMTDANGRAQTTLTLGTTGTPNNVEASAAGIQETVTFSDVAEPVVDIPDSNLRAAIETALGVASGTPIVPSDMAFLTGLHAPIANISDLTGLEAATNLTYLNLRGNSISDISPLAGLTNLTTLLLNRNSISDISPLAGLTNLTTLWLSSNNISDISPLAGLTDLGGLQLESNSISDISAIAGLTNLTGLHLAYNSISDISAIAGLTNLTSLRLNNNNITDLSPLVANIEWGSGDWINVKINPLNAASINTHIPAIESRGATVEFDNIIVQPGDPDQTVDIPDANLRALIKGSLGIASDAPITGADMARFTSLTSFFSRISDLTGFEYAINLVTLSFRANRISDLSPLAGLTNLTSLWLQENRITDLSPLAGLTNLTSLSLENNSITDLSPLVENTGLGSGDRVNVRGNPLNAASINTHIPELQSRGVTVEFDDVIAQLVDIPDPNLRAVIERRLGKASGAPITVDEMVWLTELSALNANISNLAGLEYAINLTRLILGAEYLEGRFINSNSVSDLSPLTGLTNLTELGLDGNNIADISPVEGLTNLTLLWLESNNITDISPVEGLTNLTQLGLGDNNITDISPVEGLTNLSWLYLRDNSISDISAVEGLTNLTELYLKGNSISDISPVAGLTNLTRLRLEENNIMDISAIAGLTNLTELGLWDNSISDISAVEGLTNLTLLGLWDNNIMDLSPVVANIGLGTGDTVDVSENPLNAASINTHIPALQNRGVEVLSENLKPTTLEYSLSIPTGISLIHVPLKVTEVDGVAKTIASIGDLYDALGGASKVTFLITYDSQAQEWRSYFGTSDNGTPADKELTDDTGIIVGMLAPVSIQLGGDALGTNGSSTITLTPGLNLVGLPLRDSRINRVSDLFTLEGIGGNVPVIILTDDGEFKAVGRSDDPGDIPIVGGQAFILTAQREATVAISGEAWTNASGAVAAAPVTIKGIEVGDTTPVLGLRGSIVEEEVGLKVGGFRVTVKNLLTGKAVSAVTTPHEAGYRFTVVDIETGRAATVGDVLEISARSPNPFVGVELLRYTVTAEDVKQSLIQLPELVAYEIPAETQLLANYPNPFNPETWIPYRLAEDAFVTLTIYDLNGRVVRTIDVGHQIAAVYENRSKAIYWDGRNEIGERVASGVYFYHLSAGDDSATRRMVILK